jgi:hypothetical protein
MSEAKPAKVHEAIARSLKDFGYPDVTADMIREIAEAKSKGESLPHGVVGMFAEDQLDSVIEAGGQII